MNSVMESKITKRKKIAILLPRLSGGGAERVASQLSQYLEKKNYHVFIFTERKQSGYIFEGKIILLKPQKTSSEIINLIFLAKEMKKKKKQYGIEYSISFMEQYNLANILSKKKDKVIIRICTTLSARNDLKGICYNKKIINVIYNLADKVIVMSSYGKYDMIKNYGIKLKKIKVIPNAVYQRKFDDSAAWNYGEQVILSVNRIHPIKQSKILVDTMKKIVMKMPNVKLLLVGNDKSKYAFDLKRYVKKNNLDNNIVFVGHVDNVEYYMYHSKIYVLSSLVEGFPNTVIEAMNQGLPIVTTNFTGPVKEIFGIKSRLQDAKYGIVVPQILEQDRGKLYEQGISNLSEVLIDLLVNDNKLEKYRQASKNRSYQYRSEKIEKLWGELLI